MEQVVGILNRSHKNRKIALVFIPAKAAIQTDRRLRTPAFAGMTGVGRFYGCAQYREAIVLSACQRGSATGLPGKQRFSGSGIGELQ